MNGSLLRLLALLPACLLLLAPAAQATPASGDGLTCATNPTFIFTCNTPFAILGPGVEFNLTQGPHTLTANFTGTDLILTDTDASNQSFFITFGSNPIQLLFTDLTHAFTTANLVSSTGSFFPAANVSVSGGTLAINIAGVAFQGGNTIDISLVSAAAVPEPSSIALLGIGVLGLVGAARRRSRKA